MESETITILLTVIAVAAVVYVTMKTRAQFRRDADAPASSRPSFFETGEPRRETGSLVQRWLPGDERAARIAQFQQDGVMPFWLDRSGVQWCLVDYVTGLQVKVDMVLLTPLGIYGVSPRGGKYYDESWRKRAAVGDAVELVPEPDNEYDSNAVRIDWNGHTTGYYSKTMARKLQKRGVDELVAKIACLQPYKVVAASTETWEALERR